MKQGMASGLGIFISLNIITSKRKGKEEKQKQRGGMKFLKDTGERLAIQEKKGVRAARWTLYGGGAPSSN